MFRRNVPLTLALLLLALAVPASATHPGTNGKLLFERPTKNGGNIFSVAPDGSGFTRLTARKGGEGDASWSPDGSKLAFSCARNVEPGPYEICVVNADGSGFTRLTRHRGFSFAPAWSPDGTRIVYGSNGGGRNALQLRVVNADGSGGSRLTENRGKDYSDPSWSPDGSTIAFAILKAGDSRRAFDSSLALVDANGGNLRRLTPRRGPDELNPNWSPDGASIAFEVNRVFDRRQSDIWTMSADGSGKQRLTRGRFFETNPTWSPDGTRIGFTSDRDNRNLSKHRLGRGFELYTMAADGSDLIRVTQNRRAELFPDWQPLPSSVPVPIP